VVDQSWRTSPNAVGVTWLGHATTLLELAEMRVLTDPLLTKRVVHLRRRRPIELADIGTIDVVLLSHTHMDHLHLPSLRRLGKDAQLVVPSGSGPWLRMRGFPNVTELAAGERTEVGPLVITATRAVHRSGRGPHSRLDAAPVGFVVGDGRTSIYFAGDTDLFPEMHELRGVDVALLPIWGWGPTIGDGHLDPARAVTAAHRIDAGVVVPIHWGTYSPLRLGTGAPRWLDEPAHRFAELMARGSLEERLQLLLPGESLVTR
jgi:L-ascorbate metabolism protein UlaG (beta-lactamase superfamily)